MFVVPFPLQILQQETKWKQVDIFVIISENISAKYKSTNQTRP